MEKEHAYKVQVAKAKAMATALSTIGKFEVFKKVGENKRIYGRQVLAFVLEGPALPSSQLHFPTVLGHGQLLILAAS